MHTRKQGSTAPLRWQVERDLSGVTATLHLRRTYDAPDAYPSTVAMSTDAGRVSATLPADFPAGEYLVAVELVSGDLTEWALTFGDELLLVSPHP